MKENHLGDKTVLADLLRDEDIRLIERMILQAFEGPGDYTKAQHLLELRKEMINRRVLARQEELLPDIIAFNDALRDALREMYDRAHCIWDDVAEKKYYGDEVQLTAMCFLDSNYPKLHPLQDEDREDLWSAISDAGWNKLYEWGCTLCPMYLPSTGRDESFDALIGMDCLPPNWNEGLDRELTRGLHLTSAFHHLFDHTQFAITDFIYVRSFETEIKVEFGKNLTRDEQLAKTLYHRMLELEKKIPCSSVTLEDGTVIHVDSLMPLHEIFTMRNEIQACRNALLHYCHLDTWDMEKVEETLKNDGII